MRILREPSFFFTNSTGAPHGEILGWMKPLSRRSFNRSFNFLSSIGWASGMISIPHSISLSGGIWEDLLETLPDVQRLLELTQELGF